VKHLRTLCCFVGVFVVSAGCTSINSNGKGLGLSKFKPDSASNPVTSEPASMAVVWKDSVYEQPGAPSVKGFGGRLFIYDARNNPVKADGELVVYGYDESNPIHAEGAHTGADKKFVFPSDKFQRHFSDSNLGASYSVWIPWEKVGGIRKSITLIPVFKTANGNVLRCGQSLMVLPGRKPESQNASINGKSVPNTPNLVAQASFQQPVNRTSQVSATSGVTDIQANDSNIRTTTFNLTPSLANKLTAPPTLPKPQSATRRYLNHSRPPNFLAQTYLPKRAAHSPTLRGHRPRRRAQPPSPSPQRLEFLACLALSNSNENES